MKKLPGILTVLLTFLMLFQICTAENLTYGDYTYTVLESGTVEIVRYTGMDETLMIPEQIEDIPVTVIGANAFSRNDTLQKVTVPESVIALGNYAFAESKSITEIDLPQTLLTLGDLVFQGDTSLERLTLPAGLVHIGTNPFDRCDALEEITFSENNSFYFTEDGVLFDRRNNVLMSYPTGKKDSEYIVPEWVEKIGFAAFSENPHLTEIALHQTLTEINGNPFCGCVGLTNIHISPLNRMFEMYNGALYNAYNRELIAYLWNSDKSSYTVQTGTRSIGQEAFYKHPELKTVTLPQSLITIRDAAFAESGLTSVRIPDNVVSLGANTFSGSPNLKSVILPSGLTWIARYAFSECTALTSIKFPRNLRTIEEGAFYHCSALEELVLPDNLRFLGDFAFLECTSLTSVEFPDKMVSIGRGAFYGIENLTALVSPGSLAEEWAVQSEVPYKLKNVKYVHDESI